MSEEYELTVQVTRDGNAITIAFLCDSTEKQDVLENLLHTQIVKGYLHFSFSPDPAEKTEIFTKN
jgi:hypothetical protein